MKKLLLACAVGALTAGVVSAPAHAEPFGPTPYLLKDIAPGFDSSDIDEVVPLGAAKIVFSASRPAEGKELWVSDGTPSGTKLLKDIRTGTSGSDPVDLVPFNGKLYFSADDGGHGRELWRTDGTSAGTQRVTDLQAGLLNSNPNELTVLGTRMYFRGTDSASNNELWKTDGTTAGTVKVRDNAGNGNPSYLTVLGSKLVYQANETGDGTEPWITDGTLAGTHRIKNSNPAVGDGSGPAAFTRVGSRLVFQASLPTTGYEPWVTDGTEAGTHPIADLNPGVAGSQPNHFTAYDGGILFRANRLGSGIELWSTDGDEVELVRDIYVGGDSGLPTWLTVFQDKVYFNATTAAGPELWVSKGGPSNTQLFREFLPGAAGGVPEDFMVVGSRLYFQAQSLTQGIELWSTDGTSSGTTVVKDINVGGNSSAAPRGKSGNTLLFTANDGVAHGDELWAYTTRTSSSKAYPKSSYSRSAGANKKIYVTVVVRATGTTPTGKVTLKKGSTVVGYGTLSGGKKSIHITKKLGKGSHKIKAYYSGSFRARVSVSPTFTIKVR